MAKKKEGFSKSIRNRGEDIGQASSRFPYSYQAESTETADRDQERAIRRHEARSVYTEMYRLEQERDQRAFDRTRNNKNEFYAGIDPRRRQEVADAGMIREDHRAMANLPTREIHHEYPQAGYYFTPYIDDTIRGLDNQNDDDGKFMF